jgi:cytochrome c-type biogenesis protein CcmH
MATAILIFIVPLASGLVYLKFGRPDMPDMPLASREVPEQQLSGEDALLANIEQLETHLATTPENGGLWMMLGRARLRAGRYQAAIEAFEKGVEFSPEDPTAVAELAEAMVYEAGGQVTPTALERFRATLDEIPNEPRARYYLGLALAQEGEVDAAIDGWTHLLETSPSNAPWRQQIITSIQSVLESEGRPAEAVIAALPEGTAPAATDGAGNQATTPTDQNEQIRGMVEGLAARLEEEPDDVEGWLMLGRSRMVLGEREEARNAFKRAVDLAPERSDILIAYAASQLQPSETPGGDPVVGAEAVALYEQLVTLVPDDPEPHWLLGLARAQSGDREGAVAHWQALLGLVDEGSEDHDIVKARIAALEGDEPAAEIAAGASPSPSPSPSMAPGGRASTSIAATGPGGANGSTTQAGAGSAPGPGPDDVANMAALSTEERTARIRSMVDGLAARLEDDPSDIEGWLRLAQSRNVLGEPEAAKQAYERALEAEPDNPEVLRLYASSLFGDIHPETDVATVGEDAVALYQKVIELKPGDPEAHWYLGLAAVQDGRNDDAKTHWRKVLDVLGPDHPNYAAVQSSLEQVETKTE